MTSLHLTMGMAAEQLGVSRVQLSRVANEHAAVNTEMAVRLEQWIGGPAAETWHGLQADYDLWQLRHSKRMPHVEKAQELEAT